MTTPHNFRDQLLFSEKAGDEPFWGAVYTKAFPGMVNHMPGSGDTESQRQGVDRVILLSNGRILKIDEKKRKTVYPDILLEYVSVDKTNAPGWIEKNLTVDYIAYAFMPSQTVYLFDWLLLRRAWVANKQEWLKKYRKVTAQNAGYSTLSVAIPTGVLQTAVNNAAVIHVTAQEFKKAA